MEVLAQLSRKVVRIGNSLRVTIPAEICHMLRVQEGDEPEFSSADGDILIRKSKRS